MVDVQSACGRPGSHRRSSVSDRGSPRLRVVPPTHLPTAGPPSPRRSGGRPRSTRPPLPARARQAPTQWWKEPGTTRDTSATRPRYTQFPLRTPFRQRTETGDSPVCRQRQDAVSVRMPAPPQRMERRQKKDLGSLNSGEKAWALTSSHAALAVGQHAGHSVTQSS